MSDIVLDRAIENLIATYCAVGSQGDEARIETWDGGLTCVSRLHHPVSNFAIVREMSGSMAKALRQAAGSQRAFNAYVLPGPPHSKAREILCRHGFVAAGQLHMMVGEPVSEPQEDQAVRAATFEERHSVCRFMARQFFSRHASNMRESIALATARAPVELYATIEPSDQSAC